jgi:hypothetical protein
VVVDSQAGIQADRCAKLNIFFVTLNSGLTQPSKPKGQESWLPEAAIFASLEKNPILIIVFALSCLRSQQQKCNVSEDDFLSF